MKSVEFLEIVSIKDCGYEDVYDIQMDTEHPSFIANEIVVHNCGMKELLRNLARDETLTFDDVVATTALYRPGPMDAGLLDQYVQVKQGADAEYDHPLTFEATKGTYGVQVYQEQTMQISRDLCGFSFAEADNLRKAIGKKDLNKMAEMKDKFVSGAMCGAVRVKTDDGRTVLIHNSTKFEIVGGGRHTIKEIINGGLDILHSL